MRARMLDEYLIEVGGRPFDWAAWNCCHFVSEWVKLLTARDPMEGLPAMSSRLTAHRLIGQLGGNLGAAWDRQLGQPSMPATLAQVGDIVLVGHESVEAVGICAGRTAVVLTEQGVAHLQMGAATAAWRVKA